MHHRNTIDRPPARATALVARSAHETMRRPRLFDARRATCSGRAVLCGDAERILYPFVSTRAPFDGQPHTHPIRTDSHLKTRT